MVMDTLERNQINPSLSGVEDSPVFSFIDNLSPIKPVKSAQIGQTFSSLSFPSPPRVFTSPHVSCSKDSKVLRRHNPFGASRSGVSSEDVNKFQTSEEAIADSFHPYHNSRESQGNFHDGISVVDDSIAQPGEHTDFSAEIPQALKYNNCGNPGYDPGHEANSLVGLHGDATNAYVQEHCGIDSNEVLNQGLCQFDPKGQESECNWDTDFFIFNSPNKAAFKDIMQKPDSHLMLLVPESSIYNGLTDDSKPKIEDYRPEPLAVADQMQDKHSVAMTYNTEERPDVELVSVINRGKQRRCLDFETASVQTKNSDDNLKPSSLGHSDKKQLVSGKLNSSSKQCTLSAVGLHLNALAALKGDKKVISNDKSSCGIHQPAEDCSHASDSTVDEDVNQNSPKKKRPAKSCNCKNSKCLKLYCECFAASGYCTKNCTCGNCSNKLEHKDIVLQARKQIETRNPLAFAPKVISEPEIGNDPNKTPAPARHRRGCYCEKSACLKKYCECFQAGVGCSMNCNCKDCKNTFGRKDGSNSTGVETQAEVETEACGKEVVEKASQKSEVQNPNDHQDFFPIPKRFWLSSSLIFSSEGKPSLVTSISDCGLNTGQKFGKPNTLWSQAVSVSDHQTPNVLGGGGGGGRSDRSPVTCIKISSPNGKRISSPRRDLTPSSQVCKSRRKLILQSIPSFPSPNHHR